jgi:hypothetical protein
MAKTLEDLYKNSKSPGIEAARDIGTADDRQGVNFFDGNPRGPWNLTAPVPADIFQGGFIENKEGKNVSPAGSNDGSYPLSRWKETALKIAFDGQGPITRPSGYWQDIRFTKFEDSAGRNTGTKLHTYAPVSGKRFGEVSTSAKLRIESGGTSTSVTGLLG